jgi:hypothetical protein
MSMNNEDSWADLADELGIDTPATKARNAVPPPLPEPAVEEDRTLTAEVFEELPDALESEGDTALEPGLSGEPASDGDGERKRRRRRRRGRKGKGESDGDGDGVTAVMAEDTDSEDVEAVPPEFGGEQPAAPQAAETSDHEIMDEPTPDAVRELIANWNVPSWQQIVTGLYRPGER